MQTNVTSANSKEEAISSTLSKKSGKGISDGVVSELTTFFTVKPGHEEELRAACERFNTMLHEMDPKVHQKSGLREWRQVLFDDGKRLLFMTSFEADWDPYIDDAVLVIGIDHIIDWMRHTVEAEAHIAELRPVVEAARQGQASTAALKKILQSIQVPASAYFDILSDETVPQIRKAQRVEQAFQKVLDNPEAEQALQHPALQPLLEQAAD
jgi:hypothetical protein